MLTQNRFLDLQPTALLSTSQSIASSLLPRSVPSLSLNRAVPALRSSSIGRTLRTALPLGFLSGRRTLRRAIGRQNPSFLQFTLNAPGNVRINLGNRSQSNIVSALLDEQGQLVSLAGNRLSNRIRSGETLRRSYQNLLPGTYYLRITSRATGRNVYQLTLAAANASPNLPCGCGR